MSLKLNSGGTKKMPGRIQQLIAMVVTCEAIFLLLFMNYEELRFTKIPNRRFNTW